MSTAPTSSSLRRPSEDATVVMALNHVVLVVMRGDTSPGGGEEIDGIVR
jgi:hypothetical protein